MLFQPPFPVNYDDEEGFIAVWSTKGNIQHLRLQAIDAQYPKVSFASIYLSRTL